MSDVKQTPKRRLRGVSVLAAGAVLVLLLGGVFALGQAVADQGARAPGSSSQSDQAARADGYGSMMGRSQADRRGDGSWMREHMVDVMWMRDHPGERTWMREHMDDVTWMRDHPGERTWMREHTDDVARMLAHRDDMPRAGQDWKDWGHHGPGSGRSGNGAGGGSDRPHMRW